MKSRRTINASRLSVIVLFMPLAACSEPAPKAMIPDPSDTSAVFIIVHKIGAKEPDRCVIKDERTIRELYDCVTPNEHSDEAGILVRTGPIIGKLGFQGPRGTTWVEFNDSGNNPLCFLVGGVAYARGGANYRNFRSDHKRLYGFDHEHISEGFSLYYKLLDLCAN